MTIEELLFETFSNEYEWEMSKLEIQVFTGLSDKQGKEIYEGDIVECKVGVDTLRDEVIWLERMVCFALIGSYPMAAPIARIVYEQGEFKKWKVVGNVWENPDLIKR